MDAWPNAACPPFVASLTQHAPISTLTDINFDCVSPVDVLQKKNIYRGLQISTTLGCQI